MKTWHWLALGVGGFLVFRAVNGYRSDHYQNDAGGPRRLSWAEGLLALVGVYHFPSVQHGVSSASVAGGQLAAGAIALLPTPQPAAGQSGLPYTNSSGQKALSYPGSTLPDKPDFYNPDGSPGYYLR